MFLLDYFVGVHCAIDFLMRLPYSYLALAFILKNAFRLPLCSGRLKQKF